MVAGRLAEQSDRLGLMSGTPLGQAAAIDAVEDAAFVDVTVLGDDQFDVVGLAELEVRLGEHQGSSSGWSDKLGTMKTYAEPFLRPRW